MNITNILQYNYFGNTVLEYTLSLLIFLISLFLISILKTLIIRNLQKITDKTKIKADDLIIEVAKAINWPIYILASLYISFLFINTPPLFSKFTGYASITLAAYYLTKIIQLVIDYITEKTLEGKDKTKVDKTIIDFISKVVKVIVWVVVFLIIIQNLGYDVTALVAGLGVGGIAIAFALQNVLGELFASLSIFFDKPFKVGDYITVGEDQGDVKKIGLRSTRIKTLEGDILIIPNKEISQSRVHNYQKMDRRRIFFTLGVTYETPNEKLKKIPKIIKDIVEKQEDVKFERCHFKKFSDYALIFNVVYIIKSRKYVKYLDINQSVNYKIRDAFEKENIEMAYPTQTLHIRK